MSHIREQLLPGFVTTAVIIAGISIAMISTARADRAHGKLQRLETALICAAQRDTLIQFRDKNPRNEYIVGQIAPPTAWRGSLSVGVEILYHGDSVIVEPLVHGMAQLPLWWTDQTFTIPRLCSEDNEVMTLDYRLIDLSDDRRIPLTETRQTKVNVQCCDHALTALPADHEFYNVMRGEVSATVSSFSLGGSFVQLSIPGSQLPDATSLGAQAIMFADGRRIGAQHFYIDNSSRFKDNMFLMFDDAEWRDVVSAESVALAVIARRELAVRKFMASSYWDDALLIDVSVMRQ